MWNVHNTYIWLHGTWWETEFEVHKFRFHHMTSAYTVTVILHSPCLNASNLSIWGIISCRKILGCKFWYHHLKGPFNVFIRVLGEGGGVAEWNRRVKSSNFILFEWSWMTLPFYFATFGARERESFAEPVKRPAFCMRLVKAFCFPSPWQLCIRVAKHSSQTL